MAVNHRRQIANCASLEHFSFFVLLLTFYMLTTLPAASGTDSLQATNSPFRILQVRVHLPSAISGDLKGLLMKRRPLFTVGDCYKSDPEFGAFFVEFCLNPCVDSIGAFILDDLGVLLECVPKRQKKVDGKALSPMQFFVFHLH